jgi:DNA-binding MarR family transcriptional regulator
MLTSQEYVGLLIGAARRSLHQAVLGRVGRFRLSPPQFWLLLAVHESPGATLGELARTQRIDAPRASRLMAALQRRRLVRLALDSSDRRRSHIALTDAGTQLLRELQPIAAGLRSALVEGLSDNEEDALRTSLGKVVRNLESLEKAERPSARKRKSP